MEKKVLVAYASKQGATAEIAEKIGDVIHDAGLVVEVIPAGQVRDPGAYDAIVLGSAVYYGRWQKDAVNFMKKNEKALAELPVWFFSSGPAGEGDPVELLEGWTFPLLQQDIADRIQPQGMAVFHGVVDETKLNFFEKKILENLDSPLGDFRDWDAITAWGQAIAAELT